MTLILVRFLMIGFIFYISNRFLNTLKQGSGINGVYLFIFSTMFCASSHSLLPVLFS